MAATSPCQIEPALVERKRKDGGQTESMVNVSGHARSLQQELAEAVVESQRVSELRNSARELQVFSSNQQVWPQVIF